MLDLVAHAHTATAALPLTAPRASDVVVVHMEIPFQEGNLVAVAEWHRGKIAPAVVVVHGVAGSSEDPYVLRTARALSRRGFHVIRLNQRGSGLGIGKARRLYHAGMGDDLAVVRRAIEHRDDVTSVGVLGFSLGGHVALNHAADVSTSANGARPGKLRALVSVSAPIDLRATLARFDENRRTPAKLYERLMVRSLVEKARALRGALAFDREALDRVGDIRAFDDVVTCPSHGFHGVPDYHERTSVGPRLRTIEVPTLVVHAEDDPIVPAAPLSRFDHGRDVEVVIERRGGHVGFVGGIAGLVGASTAVSRAIAHFERFLA